MPKENVREIFVRGIAAVGVGKADTPTCVLFCETSEGLAALHFPVEETHKAIKAFTDAIGELRKAGN